MIPAESILKLRPYQLEAFRNRTDGVHIWLWGRQCGKSLTLAAWAVDRLLQNPGRLVVVLSNSRENGRELNHKVADICDQLGAAFRTQDLSPDGLFENMRYETRIECLGATGRIKILAANPRTARGFSGDLILDEFAFHEDSQAIWEAVEPILAANPGYLCRIASTPNGRHNLFHKLVHSGHFPVSKVTRTEAWKQGLPIFHPMTRQPVTPDEARVLALDKAAYDQNYECVFTDEQMALLSLSLIERAESCDAGFTCDGDWTPQALNLLHAAVGPLSVGVDVGRNRDLTVISVVESQGDRRILRALLRLENTRLPAQQQRLAQLTALTRLATICVDMTGLGLCEYAQDQFGASRVRGIHFASTVPLTDTLRVEGRSTERVRVTEALATELLRHFEENRITLPRDPRLSEDLHRPGRVTSPSGQVSIAATRDEAGHADHFWSLALALEAARHNVSAAFESLEPIRISRSLA